MQPTALGSGSHSRSIAHRVAILGLVSVTIACHDAPTNPIIVRPPAAAVATDGAWLVNSLADPGDGVCSNSECTLREAIVAAQDGDRITFKSNLSGRIVLAAGELMVNTSITIEGPGARVLTVDGADAYTVFRIGEPQPVLVTISGLTIVRGRNVIAGGGGIRVENDSRLALIGSVVAGNNGTIGGGIFNHGTLFVIGSTVTGNRSDDAAAGIYSDGVLTVTRSTISGNRALGLGGGIYSQCDLTCPVALTFQSSTIVANDAVGGGGGVYFNANAEMSNTILAGNTVNGASTAPDANCVEFGGIHSFGYNLLVAGTGCGGLLTTPTDVILPSPSLVFTGVLQALLADNGGGLPTHALIERGFAVDAGYCPGSTTDQRLFPRPYDEPSMPNALDACDIGAFEWQPAETKGKGPKP
jgi:CSLREA domain-containing protein